MRPVPVVGGAGFVLQLRRAQERRALRLARWAAVKVWVTKGTSRDTVVIGVGLVALVIVMWVSK